ncbi:MAG TPA: HlyD family efflux transporter periplasmic adaptor subunit [Vicinamibacteria bacterium]|nr:HlyD family efflux transporter periplasmic adaptor subunit [Vicinamibacteria bacterium]
MKPGSLLRRPRALLLCVVPVLLLLGGARAIRSLREERVATIEVRPGRFLREVEARGTLHAVRATPIVVPPESGRSQRVAFLAEDGTLLRKGDVIVQFDPFDAQREAADGQADLAAATARIDKAAADGRKNSRSIAIDREVAREDLKRAESYKLTDETIYSRHQIIESRLSRELASTQLEVAGQRLEASGQLSATDTALGRIDAGKASFKVQMAEKSLSALHVTAPHDGLLVLERNWRGETTFVGDTLWPGQKVAELPELSQLEAKVMVLEADGAGLKPGLSARLIIEGRTEEHQATVARVEPLAKTAGWSPVRYFEATLSLARTDPSFMKPGQRVRATIRLEEADGVLAVPRGAVFDRDGRRIVYRRQSGGFVPAEVTIGRQSVSRLVIDSGLRAGDVVALRDPARKPAAGSGETSPGGAAR